jgi:hypothetical protein
MRLARESYFFLRQRIPHISFADLRTVDKVPSTKNYDNANNAKSRLRWNAEIRWRVNGLDT